MTNIQTLPSKSQPVENGRAEMGNFFQAPGARGTGNLSNPDFDSFLSNPDSKNQAEELREEQEAAKKRKKLVDATLAQGILQQQDITQPQGVIQKQNPDSPEEVIQAQTAQLLEAEKKAPEVKDPTILDQKNLKDLTTVSTDFPDQSPTQALVDKLEDAVTANPASVSDQSIETKADQVDDEFFINNQFVKSEEQSTDAENIPESDSKTRGTETAPPDDEMIAMATSDGNEPPTQALREPAITSINRLAAYASLDRTAVTPLTKSEDSSDPGLGNNATGLPLPVQSIRSQPVSASTQAAGLFKSLAPELDKFKQIGSSQVQLDLPIGEEESVRIKLSIRGGEIRSTFITESPELRDALQKAWPEFSQNNRDRGYRLGDPSFQQSFQENNANLGQNNRRQSDGRPLESTEVFAPATFRKPAAARTNSAQSPNTALWA